MGFLDRVAGVNKRDQHTQKALDDARHAKSQGLNEFTVVVHSTDGGAALLPRLVPHVIDTLQGEGFSVVNVSIAEWQYNAHLTVRAR